MQIKQVYTAIGSTDTVKAAEWVEQNSDQLTSAVFKFDKPGKANHFIAGPNSYAFTENAHILREDGLAKRAGC
jgi:hypothetical protein